MAKDNSFKIIMYLVGVVVSILLGTVGLNAKNINANDKEAVKRDAVLDEKIQTTQKEVVEDISEIKDSMTEQKVIMAEMLTTLKYLKESR